MSFLDQVTGYMFGQGISYSDAMTMGAHYTLGAQVVSTPNGIANPQAGGWTSLRTPMGGQYNFHHMKGSKFGGYQAAPVGSTVSGMGLFGIGTTLAMSGAGFYYGGFRGGMESLFQDIGISAGLALHGHEVRNFAGEMGVRYGNLGRFAGAYETLSNMGKVGRVAARGMSVASYGSRTAGAILGTSLMSSITGGGFLSMAGSAVGGSLGAKFSPFITGGAIIGGGAYLAGRGAYSVMKMGYDYRQSQKSIHTSGDLSAFNTSAALTMRGRAVQAMQNHHMNSRSALGQEATFLHNPSRSYHAPYRAGY